MGVDNIRFGWDTELNQLLIHNTPSPLCMLFTSKDPGLDITLKRIIFIGTPTYIEGVLHSRAHFSAHCTYINVLKCYCCSTLSKSVEYTSIFTISLLKWVDALVPLSAIYSIAGTMWQTLDILITTYFSFDEINLKRDVKLVVIIFNVS